VESIIIRITNGLGNQMFQYALGRKLSLLNNCPLKLDFSEYKENNLNHEGIGLNLYRFNIKGEIADNNDIDGLIPDKKRIENRILRSLTNRYKNQIGKYFFYKKNYIEDKWKGNLNIFKAKPPLYLDGGWFNFNYFQDIDDILMKDLTLKNELRNNYFSGILRDIAESKNSVGIHFRRKYALYPNTNRVFGVLDLDYYYKGIEYLNQQIGNVKLFVFADDISWVRENFKPNQKMTIIERSEYLTDSHDWELLKSCKHQIISNSTFSWWAAYLNSNINKIVLFPKIWYKDPKRQKHFEKRKPVSTNWIKI